MTRNLNTLDFDALTELLEYCYGSAQDRGFHQAADLLSKWRTENAGNPELSKVLDAAFIDRAGNRLALIIGEAIEAHEEIRKGRAPGERYYSFPDGAQPHQGETPLHWQERTGILAKPEGVPSELADIVVRVMDYAGEHKIDIADAIREKLDFNSQRAAMHGGKRF